MNGGLTFNQIVYMYESYGEERLNEFKMLGHLLGAEFKDDKNTIPKASGVTKEEQFVFRDPKDYEKMSEADRKELTSKMMERHRRWASKSSLGETNAP